MSKKEITAKALENKVKLIDNMIIEHSDCEECNEEYLFCFMECEKEKYVGLTIILKCFEIASEEKLLPALPIEWWLKVKTRYN